MSTETHEQRSDVTSGALTGALFGALAIGLVTALTVGVLGATGGIRSGAAIPDQASAASTPAGVTPTTAPAGQPGAALASLAPAKAVGTKSIARPAASVVPAITRSSPALVRVDLETQEVVAEVEKGATYSYWTFNGSIPGPMVRVRVGDTVERWLGGCHGRFG
ncbi:MAG: hypothetical protein AAB295_11165, partial [Chloroflexota bacterium]